MSGAGLLGATLPDVARALTVVSKACGLDMSKSKEITEGAHRKPIHLMCIYIYNTLNYLRSRRPPL